MCLCTRLLFWSCLVFPSSLFGFRNNREKTKGRSSKRELQARNFEPRVADLRAEVDSTRREDAKRLAQATPSVEYGAPPPPPQHESRDAGALPSTEAGTVTLEHESEAVQGSAQALPSVEAGTLTQEHITAAAAVGWELVEGKWQNRQVGVNNEKNEYQYWHNLQSGPAIFADYPDESIRSMISKLQGDGWEWQAEASGGTYWTNPTLGVDLKHKAIGYPKVAALVDQGWILAESSRFPAWKNAAPDSIPRFCLDLDCLQSEEQELTSCFVPVPEESHAHGFPSCMCVGGLARLGAGAHGESFKCFKNRNRDDVTVLKKADPKFLPELHDEWMSLEFLSESANDGTNVCVPKALSCSYKHNWIEVEYVDGVVLKKLFELFKNEWEWTKALELSTDSNTSVSRKEIHRKCNPQFRQDPERALFCDWLAQQVDQTASAIEWHRKFVRSVYLDKHKQMLDAYKKHSHVLSQQVVDAFAEVSGSLVGHDKDYGNFVLCPTGTNCIKGRKGQASCPLVFIDMPEFVWISGQKTIRNHPLRPSGAKSSWKDNCERVSRLLVKLFGRNFAFEEKCVAFVETDEWERKMQARKDWKEGVIVHAAGRQWCPTD
eukprot:TRINITY_DN26143_c0_g1_i1.p1 TRINITY_DN26143_c0_g1~~TRINITY_DN26143_c0_g1_i1.p1  ORF type:complete len:604 (-),score=86.09 TRINITY_DN26143_c0_g1_i1:78-1889(-)